MFSISDNDNRHIDMTFQCQIIIVCWCLMLGIPGCAVMNPVEDAQAAFNRQDYTRAIEILSPLAEKGNVLAQSSLGVVYQYGTGNFPEALKWYRLAVMQGNASAQYNLGVMYARGEGVIRNYQEALKWWGLASKRW